MNCPYCGTKLESERPESVMLAHPLGKGCPMGGDFMHTVIWEKHENAVRHYNKTQAGKAVAS